MPPTGDLAHNPGMCPDWESNWRPFGLQAGSQSTEPHQPGLKADSFQEPPGEEAGIHLNFRFVVSKGAS